MTQAQLAKRAGVHRIYVAQIEGETKVPSLATLEKLAKANIPAGRVRTLDEMYAWDQTLSQGLLIDVDHSSLGRVQMPGPALRFDDNTFAGARERHLPPPRLGEHNESVRAWLDSGE